MRAMELEPMNAQASPSLDHGDWPVPTTVTFALRHAGQSRRSVILLHHDRHVLPHGGHALSSVLLPNHRQRKCSLDFAVSMISSVSTKSPIVPNGFIRFGLRPIRIHSTSSSEALPGAFWDHFWLYFGVILGSFWAYF